jgi:hypothetical protein
LGPAPTKVMCRFVRTLVHESSQAAPSLKERHINIPADDTEATSLTMVTVIVLRWSGITERLTASCGRRSAIDEFTPRGAAELAMDSSM